MEDVQS
jgi:hypothetical protein